MKPHPIGLYLLSVILAKVCKAQNGYHYNRPTGRPFLPAFNNQIPNSNQKLIATYQPQGSQTSYQNDLSPNGYQYNRPSSYSTPRPQSQTVGFPQPFRPNNGATPQASYITTSSPFYSTINPTTYRGDVGAEFFETTSNPSITGETFEDFTASTFSPLNSRVLGLGTSTVTSSPFSTYSTLSPNGNYNHPTPATFVTTNRDYNNYQPGSSSNSIVGTGFVYGPNNQFVSSSTQLPGGFDVGKSSIAPARNQLGAQKFNNYGSSTTENLGYDENTVTSSPISGNVIPAGSYNQRPGISNAVGYYQNSATGSSPSNVYKYPGSSSTAASNVGNFGISSSTEPYNENLIPQGTSSFGPGVADGFVSNVYPVSLQAQKQNSFSTEASGSNNAYGGNQGSRRPSNFNDGRSSIRGPTSGFGGSLRLTGPSSGGVNNFVSNNIYGGLSDNRGSGDFNTATRVDSGPSNGYNFGTQEANNGFLRNSAANEPNRFNSGSSGNTFSENLEFQEPNNAIEGSSESPSSTYTYAGNQGSQNSINVPGSGTGFSETSNTFGRSGGFGGANNGYPGYNGPNFSSTARPELEDDSCPNGDYSNIPGTPGKDYPILSEIPLTKFSCYSQKYPGYYADIDTRCQVFHICANGLQYDFLCPNGTVFHQRYFVCVWWNQFECNSAESLYTLNENLYDFDEIGSLIANAAGTTGALGPSVTYAPGLGPQASISTSSPSTWSSVSPNGFTPSSSFKEPFLNFGSSQTQNPSYNSEASEGPQGLSFGYEGSSNYGSPNQPAGFSVTPPSPSSDFESTAAPQSSSGGFTPSDSSTPPFDYEKPSTTYAYSGKSQPQSFNFGSPGLPGKLVDYGTLNYPKGSNLRGSSARYPGYQELRPSASPQNPFVTYGPYVSQNFGPSTPSPRVTNKVGPPLSTEGPVKYGSSNGYPTFSQNLGAANSAPGSSEYFRPSVGLQEPVTTFGPISNSQNVYENSRGSPELSANLGQIGGPRGFTSTNSPSTTQESTTEYSLPSTPQTFSGKLNPLVGVSTFSDYPQSSNFKLSPTYEPLSDTQRPSSSHQPFSSLLPGYQFSSGLQVQPLSGLSYNAPGTSANYALPAGSSSLSNFNPYSHKNSATLGQQITSQQPSPSYSPLSSPSPIFGQQQPVFDSTLNPRRPLAGYSSTPNPRQSFGYPSSLPITSARFSPLSSQSSNYGPTYPPGSTFGTNFGGSQGSSLAPFTLAGSSQRPPTIYGSQSSAFTTPRPQSNYSPYPPSSTFGTNFGGSQGSSAPFTLAGSSQRPPTIYGSQSSAFTTPRPQSNYSPYPPGSTFGTNFGGSQGSSPAPFTLSGSSQRPPTIYGSPQSSAFTTSRPQSNYSPYPPGTTFGTTFGGSQGSSAPFTLAGSSQRPPTIYGSQSSAFTTPRPQPNYSPSRVNQQADFDISPKYSSGSNVEQGLNYPTTVRLNHPFTVGSTEQTPTYSPSDHFSADVTSPSSFYSPFSTIQPESYSTESNVPSNTFSGQESPYPGYDRETTLYNNAPFLSSSPQVSKPNREYLPPFRKR